MSDFAGARGNGGLTRFFLPLGIRLPAELAKVMVGVQPGPAHPFLLLHGPEEGMPDSLDFGMADEPGELFQRILAARLEVAITDSELTLIDFGR